MLLIVETPIYTKAYLVRRTIFLLWLVKPYLKKLICMFSLRFTMYVLFPSPWIGDRHDTLFQLDSLEDMP